MDEPRERLPNLGATMAGSASGAHLRSRLFYEVLITCLCIAGGDEPSQYSDQIKKRPVPCSHGQTHHCSGNFAASLRARYQPRAFTDPPLPRKNHSTSSGRGWQYVKVRIFHNFFHDLLSSVSAISEGSAAWLSWPLGVSTTYCTDGSLARISAGAPSAGIRRYIAQTHQALPYRASVFFRKSLGWSYPTCCHRALHRPGGSRPASRSGRS